MSLLQLPDEILEKVLISPGVKASDVAAISQSCKRGREAVLRSATIWRRLFAVHFPEIAQYLELHVEEPLHHFWRHHFVVRYSLQKSIKTLIEELSTNHYHRHALSNVHMEHFLQIPDADYQDGLLLIDSLQDLIKSGNPDRDLNLRYYGTMVVTFVRRFYLEKKWRHYMELASNQGYYQGLVMLSQWFQPLESVREDRVKIDVQIIALATLDKLKTSCPSHPIFNQNPVLLDHDVLLKRNRFEDMDLNLSILDCLNEVMFRDQGFRGNTANYYNPLNSFIDQVLQSRQGIPITLCILYSMVAKLLGILLEPVNFPRHFLLKCNSVFIDAFQDGARKSAEEFEQNPHEFVVRKPMEVFQRMVRNLVTSAQIQEQDITWSLRSFSSLRSALELTKIIGGDFEYPGFALCQIYLQMNINHREIMQELENHDNWPQNLWFVGDSDHLRNQVRGLRRLCMSQMEDECVAGKPALVPKLRSSFAQIYDEDTLKQLSCFSVGMVMKHKKYNYHCVIVGWDPECKASTHWIHQMGVNKLSRKEKQPFYNVLVEDGSIRYAADENLASVKPRWIDHPAVGRYFKHFHPNYGYEPNSELAKEYPEDTFTLLWSYAN